MLGAMAVDIPETRYARSGELNIAYQVVGDGPFDLVLVPPLGSHVELVWELPIRAGLNLALAEFSRLVIFDKRGTGLSDPVDRQATLEERMDDVRAVLDAVGSREAGVLAIGDGCLAASLFAATYPDRCFGLALYAPFARSLWVPDYPLGETRDQADRTLREIEASGERRSTPTSCWKRSTAPIRRTTSVAGSPRSCATRRVHGWRRSSTARSTRRTSEACCRSSPSRA
jgi:pimeloyl-ACP methyl ester carboxylesterase